MTTMPAKENRLRKKRDFKAVFKKGKSFKESFLILRVSENNLKASRFGFVVSQKVSSKAVVRNKLRRRLKEAVRLNLKGVKRGGDAVLIALPGLEKKEFSEIKEIMDILFKRAGLFNV